jgi:hypothetical protein
MPGLQNGKSLETWIWDAACSIRGAKDAPKYKDFILPLQPDDPEQPEIATCDKSLNRKIVVAGQKRDQLQDLFRTLRNELMTAKTRVHELNFQLKSHE